MNYLICLEGDIVILIFINVHVSNRVRLMLCYSAKDHSINIMEELRQVAGIMKLLKHLKITGNSIFP